MAPPRRRDARRQASGDGEGPPKASSRAAGRTRRERIRDLKLVFNDAHKYGTAALKAGDYKKFAQAVAVERGLIQEQVAETEKQRADIEKQRAVIKVTSRRTKRAHKRHS